MRIVNIRPAAQAETTAARLTELGHESVIFPLFQPEHDLDRCRVALDSGTAPLAVSSAEAVRCLQELGSDLTPHLTRRMFVVGRATARAAIHAGFQNVITGNGSGRDMAEVVAQHLSADVEPLVYLVGVKRAGGFERVMNERGIAFQTVEIYDMKRIAHSLEQQQEALVNRRSDAVLLFSREHARAFFALDVFQQGYEALRNTVFCCLSHNIAEAVPEELKNSAVVARTPDEDALLELL